MSEARRSERVRTLLGAQIIFNDSMSTVDCVIRNISSSGASLVLADTLSVPNEFELHIPQKGRSYRARLVRRHSEGISVKFHPADAKWVRESRLRELETENAQLKARILAQKARGSRGTIQISQPDESGKGRRGRLVQ